MEWNIYMRGRWVGRIKADCQWDAELLAFIRFNPLARRGLRVVRV